MTKINKSEAEWKEQLSPLAYKVMRQHGTERAGTHDDFPEGPGLFTCKGCGAALFDKETKFESGTGWPSFWAPISEDAIGTRSDRGLFMRRTEVHCADCGAHLGHVFNDGPAPTGLRYCLNGVALNFDPA